MRTSDMIKSKFWRAADLQGQPPIVLTIADVTEELMGRGGRQETKCFLWFMEHLKGLQLNKARVRVLEAAYGPDSDRWRGRKVRLSFDPTVEFGGRAVGGVRLQTPPGVVYAGAPVTDNWGAAVPGPSQTAVNVPGRPPAPVWDDATQSWHIPAPTASPAPKRPPPPVWDEASQSWKVVDTGTGEITPQPKPAETWGGAPTISERVGAAPAAAGDPDFNDDIPF